METIYDSKNNIIDSLNNINGFLRIYILNNRLLFEVNIRVKKKKRKLLL